MMTQPDALIARFLQKDAMSFEKIYELYSESLFGVINSILHDKELSEEVLQDTFVKIWNNSDRYNPKKGRFFTWMLNIARNSAIDKTRSKAFKNQRKNHTAEYFVDILEARGSFNTSVDAIGIQKFVDVLEPLCKKIIHFLFFKGYTQKETAEELEIPLGTVKTRNRICIKKLRDIVGVE
ncbi:sigma-70 family RNA polymerase sigma factor [uncultured Dokdonia sp.]|uniref:RNA polymerase sigma factor n=1 Tax=Dokdonia sp. Asnod2-E02 TaxID=3160574 RepID=UPI00261C8824|nr:sigma-70 family RNA polymerase sigma factor [uncultured Dokdonia sp.]